MESLITHQATGKCYVAFWAATHSRVFNDPVNVYKTINPDKSIIHIVDPGLIECNLKFYTVATEPAVRVGD